MSVSNTIVWKDKKEYEKVKEVAKADDRSINWFVVQACREKVEASERVNILNEVMKLVDDCSGDDGDCCALYGKLVELFAKFA